MCGMLMQIGWQLCTRLLQPRVNGRFVQLDWNASVTRVRTTLWLPSFDLFNCLFFSFEKKHQKFTVATFYEIFILNRVLWPEFLDEFDLAREKECLEEKKDHKTSQTCSVLLNFNCSRPRTLGLWDSTGARARRPWLLRLEDPHNDQRFVSIRLGSLLSPDLP